VTEQAVRDPAAPPPGGSTRREDPADANLLVALPGLARIAAAAAWRTTGWVAGAYARASSRMLRAAVSGESPAEAIQEIGSELRAYLRELLDLTDGAGAAPAPQSPSEARRDGATGPSLRERGADLLRRSADVSAADDTHPAYERILDELAPDEGRILRLLALEGPQPAVDVRTGGALGVGVGSELVAPGLNMIGAEAGCRRPDRVPAYLNNLERLGLVWFSREPLSDQSRYQVIEAQPEVIQAMQKAGRARTIRRSINLTPFGDEFCEAALPLHTGELDALPGDALLRNEPPGPQPDADSD
jgi:Abortive infection alpha